MKYEKRVAWDLGQITIDAATAGGVGSMDRTCIHTLVHRSCSLNGDFCFKLRIAIGDRGHCS